MAIEPVFQRLTGFFETMQETLQSLALTVIEDRPARGEVLLVERLGDLVETLRGWTEEAQQAAIQARQAVIYPPDFNRARVSLGLASEQCIRLKNGFYGEAVCYEMIGELQRFGRERGREWLGWSGSVAQALEDCRPVLQALDEALLQAWLELTERLTARSVSVQTTNIGQQISAPLPDARSLVRDGLT